MLEGRIKTYIIRQRYRFLDCRGCQQQIVPTLIMEKIYIETRAPGIYNLIAKMYFHFTSIFWVFLEAGQFHTHHHLELVERRTHFKQIPRPYSKKNISVTVEVLIKHLKFSENININFFLLI